MFSMIHQQRGLELSQGHVERKSKRMKISESEVKLGRVFQIDACEVQDKFSPCTCWHLAIYEGLQFSFNYQVLLDHVLGLHIIFSILFHDLAQDPNTDCSGAVELSSLTIAVEERGEGFVYNTSYRSISVHFRAL